MIADRLPRSAEGSVGAPVLSSLRLLTVFLMKAPLTVQIGCNLPRSPPHSGHTHTHAP